MSSEQTGNLDRLKTCRGATCCPVAVVVRDGKVLTGLRHYTPEKWSDVEGKGVSVWTIPGGRCDENEMVENTLRREVAEEVGITDLRIERFLGEFPGAKEGDQVPVFLCKTEQDFSLKEPEKFSEWRWTPLDDLPENFINSHVRDMLKKLTL